MKGKPVLKPLELFGIGEGKRVIYNGEWGSNVIYTIAKTFPQLTYCDLQNNDRLTYRDIFSAHISELAQVVIKYHEEVTNPVSGKNYYNTYDGKIWEYRPAPCPMPYWGNAKTLREIKQLPLSEDDYQSVMTGGTCPHCADIDLEASKYITGKCETPALPCQFEPRVLKNEVEFEKIDLPCEQCPETPANINECCGQKHYVAKIKAN